jgi:hypothetical protein
VVTSEGEEEWLIDRILDEWVRGGGYNLTDRGALNINVTLGISNNVQSVTLLADPHPYIPDRSDNFIPSNSSLHLGVLTETESLDSGKEDNDISKGQNSGPLV